MPEEFDDFGIPIKKQSVASENDTHDEFGIPVKKKELSAKSEPSGGDSKTPSPLLEKSGEDKSFTERVATNNLPQTFAKQQTKQKSDAEILAEKKRISPALTVSDAIKTKESENKTPKEKSFMDEIGEYANTVLSSIQQGWKQGELSAKFNESLESGQIAKSNPHYSDIHEQDISELASLSDDVNKIQKTKSVQDFEQAKEGQDSWEAFKKNPLDITTSVILQSGAALLSSTLNAKSNNSGGVASLDAPVIHPSQLMAEKGYNLGMASDMLASLQEAGVDLKNPESIKNALEDENKIAEIYKKASNRNVPIAIVDAFTGGVATKIVGKMARTAMPTILNRAKQIITGTAIETSGAMAGEASGQLASEGKIKSTQDILLEGLGEVGQGAPNVISGIVNNTKDGRVQVQEPTEQSATITEGAKPSAFTTKQQEPDGKPASTEANKGATVESAIIEIGGETFEGKNHAEAILKAQQAGKDISQVDRQGEGMFKLSDGTVISREQAKETFGADKAEMLITQDDNANKANDDYEKVKTEFKREDIANKIASNDTGGIANTPIEDVPLLVQERTNPTENVLTVYPIQESNTPVVEQPTITGAQEQEGANGVQAVSEDVQETGAANAENMPISEEREQNKITNEPTKEQNIQASVLDQSGAKDSDTEKGTRKVEKTILTKRAYSGNFREGAKRELEKYGLDRPVANNDQSILRAKKILKDLGEDVAFEAVKGDLVKGSVQAALFNELIELQESKMIASNDDAEISELYKKQAELVHFASEKATEGGQYNQIWGKIYQDSNLYNLRVQTEKYKKMNGGVIPSDIEQKFKEYDEKIKELDKKIAEANEKTKEKEAHIAILELQDAEQKATNEKTIAAKKQAAKKKVNDGLSEMFGALASISGGKLSAVDSDEKIIRGARKAIEGFMEEASITFEEAFNKLKEAVKSKGYNTDKLDEIRQNLESESTQSDKKESLFGLGNKKLRELAMKVEMGKDVTPEQQVKQYVELIKNEISETHEGITDREIRDEISGYGKVIIQSKEDGQKELSKMKNLFRGVSQLEDIGNGEPPKKSGFQREPTDTDVRLIFRRVREALKTLPLDPETKEGLLKTAEQSYLKRLTNRIEDLKKENDTRIRVKKEKNQPLTSKEIIEARDTIAVLEKEHDEIFGGDIANERIENTIKSRIQKIEQELASGEPKQPNTTQTELSDDNKTLKSELEVLKEIRESVFGINKNNKDKAKNKQLMAKAEGLIEQLENGRKQKENSKKSELNDEGKDIKKRIEVLQDVYNSVFEEEIKAEKEAKQNESITKSLEERIKKVKEELSNGTKTVKLPSEQRVLSERNKALKSELETLSEIRDYVLSETKTKIPASKKNALEAKITRLINEIETGKQEVKAKPKLELTPEEKNLTDRIAILKDIHAKAFEEEIYLKKQSTKLKASKSALNKRIADLEKKIANNDFSKRKITPLIADNELTRLRAQKEALKEKYDDAFAEYEKKNRSKWQKILDGIGDAWQLPRVSNASMDASFMGVQGKRLMLDALLFNRASFVEATKNMLKIMSSEKRAEQFINNIKAQEWYDLVKESKLSITKTNASPSLSEEGTYAGWTELAWDVIGASVLPSTSKPSMDKWRSMNPFKAFERASVGFLDTLRIAKFLEGVEKLKSEGLDIENNKQAYKDVADYVNTVSGRASLGAGERFSKQLTSVFYSPRNWASTIKNTTPYAFYHYGKMRSGATGWQPSVAQKLAIQTFATKIGYTIGMVSLAAVYLNNDDDEDTGVSFDSRSKDFLKIRLKGGVVFDPWGGAINMTIFMSQIIHDLLNQKAYVKDGKEYYLGMFMSSPTSLELVERQVLNKVNPTMSFIVERASVKRDKEGNMYSFGQKYDVVGEAMERIIPMIATTIKELYNNDPSIFFGIKALAAFEGESFYVQKKKEEKGEKDKKSK